SQASEKLQAHIGVCTNANNATILAPHGYSYIEEGVSNLLMPLKSDEEFNEKLILVRQGPLPVIACNGFIPGNLKSVGPNADHTKILAYVETTFRRAQMVGVGIIVFGSGGSRSIPEGFSREEARNQFIQLCKAIGPLAQRYNVTVVLEPLNKSEVNFINSVVEGGQIVEEVAHPNFMLLADIYHMLKEGEGPESITKYQHLIKHVHVAEHQDRAVPGTFDEDLSPFYAALQKVGYQGMISIEGRWADMEQQAEKAIKVMKSQF
ncbi:MAG TPA: sugar phosphate isomerase/epimerase family protein, partial [Saprospiraceae bacterium]|nr:sugar phosphate isomerase/epimerase family protein [Saprospiraceae bacterium]